MTYTTPPSDARASWQDLPATGGSLGGRITTTWMQEREAELRRRSGRILYRIVFPRTRIPILRRFPTLA
jgi:hypothetical protein